MLTAVKRLLGRESDEQGFTLIELMVVVLIIAILLAIAIPTFLGARDTANARAAQSNLRNALTAEQTYWTNNQAFDATPADMTKIESSLVWSSGAVAAGNTVSVALDGTNNGVILTATGKDNHCYSLEAVDQPVSGGVAAGTYYYEGGTIASGGTCSAPTAPTATPTQANASNPTGAWSLAW